MPEWDFNWLSGQPAQGTGSGVPYASQYGGYGAPPAVANSLYSAQNPGGGWSSLGLPEKMGVVGQGFGAFNTLAQIYSGFKAMKLQKDMFNFQKDAWNKNYNNQLRDYENELRDRWEARSAGAAARGRGFESMDSWLAPRRLSGTYSASSGAAATPPTGG